MGIRESSKKIVRYLLEEAIKSGDLNHQSFVSDIDLSKELGFDNEKFLVVCVQYLKAKGFITSNKEKGKRYLTILASGIDFLEQS